MINFYYLFKIYIELNIYFILVNNMGVQNFFKTIQIQKMISNIILLFLLVENNFDKTLPNKFITIHSQERKLLACFIVN